MADKHGRPKELDDFAKTIATFSSHYDDRFDDYTSVPEEERKMRQTKAAQITNE
jgi:hypothetical protein